MRLRYKKLILFFTLAIMLIGMGTFSIVAPNVSFSIGKSKGNSNADIKAALEDKSEEDITSEINTLVKDYFDAKLRVDMDALKECVSDINHVDEKRLVTEAEYYEAYKNIECTIKNKGLDPGCYRVYVYYETKIYDIDTLTPALNALYVTMDKNGKFFIYLNVINEKSQKAIEALDNSAEIKKKISDVQKKLETIVSQNADVRDFYQMLESTGVEDSKEDNEGIQNEGTTSQGTSSAAPSTTTAPSASVAPTASATPSASVAPSASTAPAASATPAVNAN